MFKPGKVGSIMVFSKEGAINVYKIFVKECYKNLTMESSVALSSVEDDMAALGFSRAEIEDIEIATISNK